MGLQPPVPEELEPNQTLGGHMPDQAGEQSPWQGPWGTDIGSVPALRTPAPCGLRQGSMRITKAEGVQGPEGTT